MSRLKFVAAAQLINRTVMKPVAADLCLVVAGVGRISLQSPAKVLDQLRVRIDWAELLEPLASKPSVAASVTIREIAWESDRRFAGTREIEVRHRVKAAGESSFANARVRIEQERLRFLYSNSGEVVDEIHPRGFLEHLAKVIAGLLITPCDAVV